MFGLKTCALCDLVLYPLSSANTTTEGNEEIHDISQTVCVL